MKALTAAAYTRTLVSKRIRVSEDAYDRLAAHKREDETLADVILRLAGERSLLDIAGILSDVEADATREAVAERRERRAEDLDEVADGMCEA